MPSSKKDGAIYDELAESEDLNADQAALPQDSISLRRSLSRCSLLWRELPAWQQWFALSLGTDIQGRSIARRAIFSIEIAIKIGIVVAFFSVLVGAILGTAAGFYGGWVDHCRHLGLHDVFLDPKSCAVGAVGVHVHRVGLSKGRWCPCTSPSVRPIGLDRVE